MEQRHRASDRRLLAVLLAGASVFVCVRPSRAAEDAEAFLAALRERNLHELALDYLQARKDSLLVSEDFRQRIPYEEGMTLIARAERTGDLSLRTRLLQEAQERLAEFASANPESDLGGEARLQLAQVMLERGRQDIIRAERRQGSEEQGRQEVLETARATMEQARVEFTKAEEYYNTARKKFPTNLDPQTEADKIERRDEYRLQWLTAWFYKARTQYEWAKAYPPDSPEFKEMNGQAAKELAELAEKYRTRLVGLTAHLYEGRAYQALGELDRAIVCFEDLVIQPDGPPEFRLLITQAFTGLAECLLKQEKVDELMERCEGWLKGSTSEELRRPEWLAVRLLVARARKQKAVAMEDSPAKNRLLRDAREEFKLIAREPGPLRREAQQEFASLTNRGTSERAAAEIVEFNEAFQLGRDAFDEMQALSAQAAAEADADKAGDLADMAEQSGQRAKAYFQRAMVLAHSANELDMEQLHLARYYLAWLHFQDDDYYRAALLGEFLARRYPDSRPARDGAKVAIGAYQQLYRDAKAQGAAGDELDFEARRMAGIADYVVRRWPDTEDAAQAQDMLVSFAIREGRLDEAKAMLEAVDPARRLQSELRVANGLWAEFLEERRGEGSENGLAAETLHLRDEAQKRLEAGFREAAKSGEVSTLAATTGLYLAQSHLLADEYAEAIAVLEAKGIGPLALVQEKHAAVSQNPLVVEVMKTALQAFALVTPVQQEKAGQAMETLEKALASAKDGATQLTQIYLGLGIKLRERLEGLQAAGAAEEAQQVAAGFAGLLDRLSSAGAENDWDTRVWTAHTYYEVGQVLAEVDRGSSLARSYLEESLAGYAGLLELAKSDANFAPNERAVLAVRKREADVLREMGRFREAMDIYSAILAENAMMLDVQRDAAYAYQLWGGDDARRLENAIFGGRRVKSTGENLVWGWIKLSKIAAQAARQDDKYRDWYFEARHKAAEARYLSALAVKGDERTSQLHKAKNAVRALRQFYPDLGGHQRQQEFDALMRHIQSALNEPIVGLEEFGGGSE